MGADALWRDPAGSGKGKSGVFYYGVSEGENDMFVVNNFMMAIAQLLDFLLSAYMWIIIGRAVISWVNADPYNPVVRFLYEVTEPLLSRIRKMIPFNMGGIDFSPMILILVIMFLQSFLVKTLKQMATTFG
jgi:YggT family protein